MVDMLLEKYDVVSVVERLVALAGRSPEAGGRKAVMRGFLHPGAVAEEPPAAVRLTHDVIRTLLGVNESLSGTVAEAGTTSDAATRIIGAINEPARDLEQPAMDGK